MHPKVKAPLLRAELAQHFPQFPRYRQEVQGRPVINDGGWQDWYASYNRHNEQQLNKRRAALASRRTIRNRADDGGDGGDVDDENSDDDDARFMNTLAACRSQARWKRKWQQKRQKPKGTTNHGRKNMSNTEEETDIEGRAQRIPRPPRPPPLPPCLQCVQAGVCCSLTTNVYAQGFSRGLEADPAQQRARGALAATRTEYNKVSAELAKLSRRSDDTDRHNKNVADAVQQSGVRLTRKKNKLQQKLLREAVAAGETDSPLLALPPAACSRCARNGIAGCLQQSRDLTGTTEVFDDNNNRDDATTMRSSTVDWFASSGPPPNVLLLQHCRLLRDQIWKTATTATTTAAAATASKKLPLPVRLEAVFCRDPAAMTAPEVAARAQSLLQEISARSTSRNTAPRIQPAAAEDVTKLLTHDNRSSKQRNATTSFCSFPSLDIHAGQGIATAAVSYRNNRVSWFDMGKGGGGIFGAFGFSGFGATANTAATAVGGGDPVSADNRPPLLPTRPHSNGSNKNTSGWKQPRQRKEHLLHIEEYQETRFMMRAKQARWRQKGGAQKEEATDEDATFKMMEMDRLASLKRQRERGESPLSPALPYSPSSSSSTCSTCFQREGDGNCACNSACSESSEASEASEADVLAASEMDKLLAHLMDIVFHGKKEDENDDDEDEAGHDADDEYEKGNDDEEDWMPSPPSTPQPASPLILQPSLESLKRLVYGIQPDSDEKHRSRGLRLPDLASLRMEGTASELQSPSITSPVFPGPVLSLAEEFGVVSPYNFEHS